MMKMIGKTISHYKILAKLGEACPAKGSRQARGGMGVVYKAKDTKLAPACGMTFLSASALGNEDKGRFLREAQAATALNHPNIA